MQPKHKNYLVTEPNVTCEDCTFAQMRIVRPKRARCILARESKVDGIHRARGIAQGRPCNAIVAVITTATTIHTRGMYSYPDPTGGSVDRRIRATDPSINNKDSNMQAHTRIKRTAQPITLSTRKRASRQKATAVEAQPTCSSSVRRHD